MVSANFVRSKGGIPSRLSHTDAVSTVGAYGKASLYSINVRLVGVGFRATVLKIYLQELQEPFATSLSQSRFLRGDSAEGTYGARPAPKGGAEGTYGTPSVGVHARITDLWDRRCLREQSHRTGCISIGRFSALGAEGCKFKSCHPDGV